MIETTAAINNLAWGMGGELLATFSLPKQHTEALTKLKNEALDLKIDKHRNKRSLSSNAYCWQLITKIAEKMFPPMSKQACYEMMLKRYGQGGFVIVQKGAQFESIVRTFDYYESKATPESKDFEPMMVWVGSHWYNSREMWVFISGIVEEARDQGIETLTPAELEKMNAKWEKSMPSQ